MNPRKLPGEGPPPESEVQAEGMAWMRGQGSHVFRRNTGGMYDAKGQFVRFSEPGASDTWIITPAGIHGEVEWKKEGERPTLDQVMWLLKTNGPGHNFSFWVDNIRTLQAVYRAVVNGGCRISYLRTTRSFTTKKGKMIGPTGDFDVVSDVFR
jgi:hypothetical protein